LEDIFLDFSLIFARLLMPRPADRMPAGVVLLATQLFSGVEGGQETPFHLLCRCKTGPSPMRSGTLAQRLLRQLFVDSDALEIAGRPDLVVNRQSNFVRAPLLEQPAIALFFTSLATPFRGTATTPLQEALRSGTTSPLARMKRELRDDFVRQMLIVFMKVPVTQLLGQMTDPAFTFYQRAGQSLFQHAWKQNYVSRAFLGALIPSLRARVEHEGNLSLEEQVRLGKIVTSMENLAKGSWIRNFFDRIYRYFGGKAIISEFPELEGIPMGEVTGALGNTIVDAIEQNGEAFVELARDSVIAMIRGSHPGGQGRV
jgi:hypothetical protein